MTTGRTAVSDRIGYAIDEISLLPFLLGCSALLVIGMTLFALQEPAVHAALHDFRHGAGITCH